LKIPAKVEAKSRKPVEKLENKKNALKDYLESERCSVYKETFRKIHDF
jgi:hypothetical protein